MHAQQYLGVRVDRILVIGDPRAIGRTDFAENGIRFRHHIGDTERASDFDKLPAGNDDLAAVGERVEGKKNRGRVIVDHDGRDRGRNPLARTAKCNGRSVSMVGMEKFSEKAIYVNVPVSSRPTL